MRKKKKLKEKSYKKESKDMREQDWLDMLMCLYMLGFNKRFPQSNTFIKFMNTKKIVKTLIKFARREYKEKRPPVKIFDKFFTRLFAFSEKRLNLLKLIKKRIFHYR